MDFGLGFALPCPASTVFEVRWATQGERLVNDLTICGKEGQSESSESSESSLRICFAYAVVNRAILPYIHCEGQQPRWLQSDMSSLSALLYSKDWGQILRHCEWQLSREHCGKMVLDSLLIPLGLFEVMILYVSIQFCIYIMFPCTAGLSGQDSWTRSPVGAHVWYFKIHRTRFMSSTSSASTSQLWLAFSSPYERLIDAHSDIVQFSHPACVLQAGTPMDLEKVTIMGSHDPTYHPPEAKVAFLTISCRIL